MVHSHGIHGGVVNLAPMTLGSSSMVGGWGTSGLHGRLHEFVKRALLQQLVSPGSSVCDLFCGRGADTANWANAGIGNYIGIDLSASALEEAKEQWEKHCQPFPATFQELDPCTGSLEILQDAGLPVDIVTCFAHLQDYFASEDMARLLLRNVGSLLKPGGYFFGTTPDSSTIWYKYQKAVEEAMRVGSLRVNGTLPRVRSPLYTITFEDDRFQFFGSNYQLRFVDGLPAQMQQLVHFPSFIRLAEEVGLEYIEIQNLTEFYDDYRVPFASTLQSSCKNLLDQKGQPMVDSRGKLSMVATDVLSLYSTFIFKKSNRVVRPASYLDSQLESECQLEIDLEECSLKSQSSPEISIGFPITPETTSRDCSPRKNSSVFSLPSGEDFMSSPQAAIFDPALPKEESPVYNVHDSASPSGRIDTLLPQHVTDSPNFEAFFNEFNFLTDTDPQLHFQETDHVAENKSTNIEEKDISATIPLDEDLEVVQEHPVQNTETVVQAGEDCHQHLENETPVEEELLATLEEVAASPQRTTTPRKDRPKGKKNKKKRSARFCPTAIDHPTMSRQTCSVNYQSEVEEDAMDPELEVSVPAPPTVLFYQRKRRAETKLGDAVLHEASFSTNTETRRALRPRRPGAIVVGKFASAVTKGARRSKVEKSRAESSSSLIPNEEEPRGFGSDGALAGGHGGNDRGKGKASNTLKDNQLPAQVSLDAVANGRRATRSCNSNVIRSIGDSANKGKTSESSDMVFRMTRMRSSNIRRSF